MSHARQFTNLHAQRTRAVTWLFVLGALLALVMPAGAAVQMQQDPQLPATLKADEGVITLTLRDVPIGLYSFYLHGRIDPAGREQLERIWRPAPMQFEAHNAAGERVSWGRRLLKQGLETRRMQGFHLHVHEAGDYTLTFRLLPAAQETAIIERIDMVDQLADLPSGAVKRSQNLGETPHVRLEALTAERQQRDRLIWDAMPPLNVHLQVHAQVAPFRSAPKDAYVPQWQFKAWEGLRGNNVARALFAPLDIVNEETGETITHEQVLAGEPLPGGQWQDDGTGLFFSKADYPELEHDIYYAPWAQMMGRRVQLFVGYLGAWDHRGLSLVDKFVESGNPEIAHDAAIALVRVALDWPALEMNLHEFRLNTTSSDLEYNTDWSQPRRRTGKYFYSGWSGAMTVDFFNAYDRLFPYIQDNQVFADAVNRFISWVKTPEDVIALLDQRLVFASVRDYRRSVIRAASIEDMAGEVLGPHPRTAEFFDLTQQYSVIYPYSGTYQELYASALTRMGHYQIGSTFYATGDAAEQVRKGLSMKRAREAGLDLKMDLSDVHRYPRVRSAADFLIDQWIAGGYRLPIGHASGGTHAPPYAMSRLANHREASEAAVELWNDPRHAWLLKHLHNVDDPQIDRLASNVPNPILHNPSRVLPAWAGIIELNVEATDLREKTAAFMNISSGQGHSDNDQLDLNFFALGLPVAVDLAQRNEGSHWTRPHAGWSFLHNHALAHDSDDPKTAGNQTGEPWLRAFDPPLMRGSYVDQSGDVRHNRDVILMQVGDSATYYAFDVQKLAGSAMHTWAFHGIESDDLNLNVPMREEVVRWTDRTLPERGEGLPLSQRKGEAVDNLQATWTATRESREYPHHFMGGGTVKTVALEPTLLGDLYDPDLPPVRMRATLLGHGGATVLSAKAFSGPYNYAFPFLWVQHEAGPNPSVYPAIYEWYRGDEPTVAEAKLLQREPLQVQVTTTTGQVDTYQLDGEAFTAVSRDQGGVRWAQLSGGDKLTVDGLHLNARAARISTPIVAIDYDKHTFRTEQPLPALSGATIGNEGHRTYVHLTGEGREFTWRHDLLAHQGNITKLNVVDEQTIDLETNQRLFQAGHGNRKPEGFVTTNEDHTWHFRDGKLLHAPRGVRLSADVFTDANGDGLTHAKTYEIGLGDEVTVLSSVIVRRTRDGHEVLTNVPVRGQVNGASFNLQPSQAWQPVAR